MRVLSLAQARRIALAAQGFGVPRPRAGSVTARHLRAVADTVGAVQIDSVNVLVRSHYLPFFSRLGPYDMALLDRARDRAPRRLVEYRAHEACLIPAGQWPLHRHRMQSASITAWGQMRLLQQDRPGFVDEVDRAVAEHGPATSRELAVLLANDRPGPGGSWGWNWSDVKVACEYLFWAGRISSAGRTSAFERRYAALSDVAPPQVRAAWLDPHCGPGEDEALVELVRIAAGAHGVATAGCLADYFRLSRSQADAAVARLVAQGELEPVTIDGWRRPAYLHVAARRPRELHVAALVSPFDSLVWWRERTEALFGVRYRIEIYTPAAARVHGYYVLPFLFGERIVARVDLKADRACSVLRVKRLTWEPDAPPQARPALDGELAAMALWLGLSEIAPALA
ncbi:MAG: crosslink repair DNA glycosylase YcaQ family protein [Dermatophilaceae bacterium]